MHSGGDNVASGTAFPSPCRLVPVSVSWVTPPLNVIQVPSDWLGDWGSYDWHRLPPRSNSGRKRGLGFAGRVSESEASGVSRSFKQQPDAAHPPLPSGISLAAAVPGDNSASGNKYTNNYRFCENGGKWGRRKKTAATWQNNPSEWENSNSKTWLNTQGSVVALGPFGPI